MDASGETEPDLAGRSLLKDSDLTKAELLGLVHLATRLREAKRSGEEVRRLQGRNIALIFEKPSTRTRSAFEVAAHDQGAHVSHLGSSESHLGAKESVRDGGRVLGRMFDGIAYRGSSQAIVEELAASSELPVWNALTDEWHPTQMLADVLTMLDHTDKAIEEVTLCYLGDARNNTANSLLVTAASLGMDLRMAAPAGLWPDEGTRRTAARLADRSGGSVRVTEDVDAAVKGADFLYTDVWLSMGEPESIWSQRIAQLSAFQVSSAVIEATGNADVRFLHCLPALHNAETTLGRRLAAEHPNGGLEVTDEVFESPASVVFDQAENRLHTIKALIVATMAR
ncbi:MAG: ornithine carbamoyltransferase [Acidimicrobiales bacterium]